MNAKEISLDKMEDLVLSSTSKRLGISIPSYLDVSGVMLRKAAQLSALGEHVVVVCATKYRARQLSAQVETLVNNGQQEQQTAQPTAHGQQAQQVAAQSATQPTAQFPVLYVGEVATHVLENEQVQKQVKRTQRVLDANEIDVLMEDIKVTGIKPKRLREMLKFFYHSISDCSAEKEGWLETQEEAFVYAVLEENLEARRACLPCEIYAKAYLGMQAANVKPEPCLFIVDDFGALSASAQRLLEYLSCGNIIAFGNDEFLSIDDEPYPSPAGMRAFLDSEKTQAYCVSAQAPVKKPVQTLSTPSAEFEYIAGEVAKQIELGAKPSDIVVTVPNSIWAKHIAAKLNNINISAFVDLGAAKTKGDPRDAASSSDIKLAAFAKLLANPNDFTAYRTFIGVNDYLLRSDGFLELLAFAREREIPVPEAIHVFCEPENIENATVSFKKFLEPMHEYDVLRQAFETQNVGEICKLMQEHGMPLGKKAELLGKSDEKPNLTAFVESFTQEELVQSANSVVIVPYYRSHAHACKILYIAGMVDGFMPKRDAVDDAFDIEHRARALARDKQMLESIEAIASQEIHYTNFQHDALENTGALNMVTTRIYHKDGRRMACVSPSALLEK